MSVSLVLTDTQEHVVSRQGLQRVLDHRSRADFDSGSFCIEHKLCAFKQRIRVAKFQISKRGLSSKALHLEPEGITSRARRHNIESSNADGKSERLQDRGE